MKDALKVFVSSTSEDLHKYRLAVRDVINEHQWIPVMMEHMGARAKRTVDSCLEQIAECDLMVLLVAHRRGWVPTPEEGGDGTSSITALELAHAKKKGIDVLPLMATERGWPGDLWENENQESRDWVRNFRKTLNQPAAFFSYDYGAAGDLLSFGIVVGKALLDYKRQLIARERDGGKGIVQNRSSLAFTIRALCEGARIPFVGSELEPGSGLSSRELAAALAGKDAPLEGASLATAAEYVERAYGLRQDFLDHFIELIRERSDVTKRAESCTLEFLAKVNRLPLIVATDWSDALERRFAREGLSYVVVSHVMSSLGGTSDGRILLMREDGSAEISLADSIALPNVDRVIYRPLGSPLLQEKVDPDLQIDTVVVTESDHLTFITRLQNQHTQIPTAFHRPFQRLPLVFLGYALDVWQYRILRQVFHLVHIVGDDVGSVVAVRRPETQLEELAWQHLGARVYDTTPEEFCRTALSLIQSTTNAEP
jgi:hypothetical protein